MCSDKNLTAFANDEDGAATPFALGMCLIFIVIGGLAVDFNKAMGERTQMQMATDSAAHAAAYSWEFKDTQESTTIAMNTIGYMLPDAAFIDALQPTDIEYGYWDPATSTFVADDTFEEDKDSPLRSAVRAYAELEPSRNNESRNILLSIIGQDTFTIRTKSIYATYYPPCMSEGFVADDVVDMQSNSNYLDGFCMHSNTYVSLNQNNYFEPGTVVSMPNIGDLDIPSSGFDKNEGLQTALRQGKYRMRLLRQLPDMMSALYDGQIKHGRMDMVEMAGITEVRTPIYPLDMSAIGGKGKNAESAEDIVMAAMADHEAGNSTPLNELPRMNAMDSGKKTVTPLHFAPGNRIFTSYCSGNGDMTMSAGTYRDFALITNCAINFANGVVLDGVLIATEKDVTGSHVQIGLDDNCSPDGNASIWTLGSFRSASGLQAFGAQILAHGDIEFAAQANGMEGVSFIAYGRIDGTSQNDLGYCDGEGTDNFAEVPYYRMVE